MGVRSLEHIGIIVRDLDAAVGFFELLGSEGIIVERGERLDV